MKTRNSFALIGVVVFLLLLLNSCSKDNDLQTQPQEQWKTGAFGNKKFTDSPIQKVFTKYNGSVNFANNSGNTHFTGSNGPGSGSATGNGNFTYDGISYPLIFGGYAAYEDGWYEVILIDQVFNIGDDPINANAVGFDIRSGSLDELADGHYYYSQSEYPYTFYWAGIVIHLNTNQEEFYDFIDGDLGISKSGDTYSLTFAGFLDNGKAVSGYFTGKLIDLDFDPDPTPTAVMNAQIGGVSWNATAVYAYTESQNSYISIYGENNNGDFIALDLDKNAIYTGASLSLSSGIFSIVYGNYNTGDNYFASEYANVNITSYLGTSISGTFSFSCQNYNNMVVVVTNGIFANVPVTEY